MSNLHVCIVSIINHHHQLRSIIYFMVFRNFVVETTFMPGYMLTAYRSILSLCCHSVVTYCHHVVTHCHDVVTMLLSCCHNIVTMLSPIVTMLSQCCHSVVTMLLSCCHIVVTMLSPCCHHVVAMLFQRNIRCTTRRMRCWPRTASRSS